ncbi:MAG: hypothetical protein IJV37_08260 [Bacteroidales bacterium]|nr:hypothetical protein [Bacteroidales bacterium]
MKIKFSQEMLTILSYARDEAMRTGSYGIGVDHVVLGMLRHRDNNACRALAACGIDPDVLKEAIDARVFGERAVPWQDQALVRPTRAAAALLSGAGYETLRHAQSIILSSHFLLALIRSEGSAAVEILRGRGLDYDRLYALMREHRFVMPQSGQQESLLPRMEDLLGPLGEQLTHLYGDIQAKTNFIS